MTQAIYEVVSKDKIQEYLKLVNNLLQIAVEGKNKNLKVVYHEREENAVLKSGLYLICLKTNNEEYKFWIDDAQKGHYYIHVKTNNNQMHRLSIREDEIESQQEYLGIHEIQDFLRLMGILMYQYREQQRSIDRSIDNLKMFIEKLTSSESETR